MVDMMNTEYEIQNKKVLIDGIVACLSSKVFRIQSTSSRDYKKGFSNIS